MNMQTGNERRIALFIDFENLVTNTGLNAQTFDLRPALDLLFERGKVIFRRAYCDWSRFKDAKAGLHEQGVELIDVPPSTRAGKNGADMRLVIDALELNYARQHIDTFAIASGDSDFCPLAYKLRENDKTVIGLAIKEATSPLFVRACDEFLYLNKARSAARGGSRTQASASSASRGNKSSAGAGTPAAAAANGSGTAPSSSASGAGSATGPSAAGKRERRKEAVVPELAREVVSSLLSRTIDPLNPSFIKETMVRKEPDFDERDHGFSTFSKMLAAMEKEGLLKREQIGTQWYVLPTDLDLDED